MLAAPAGRGVVELVVARLALGARVAAPLDTRVVAEGVSRRRDVVGTVPG